MDEVYLHISNISRVSEEDRLFGETNILKRPGDGENSAEMLKMEADILQKLQNRGCSNSFISWDAASSSLQLKRLGTHDLSDVYGDLNWRSLIEILTCLILEINSIHEAGYVHRDLKPGNVMVKQQRKRGQIIGYSYEGIVDFGLSMQINRMQAGIKRGGTPPFTHPSQLEDSQRAHIGQDWYSLGIIILFLIKGIPGNRLKAEMQQSSTGLDITELIWPHLVQKSPPYNSLIVGIRDLVFIATQPDLRAEQLLDELAARGKGLAEIAKQINPNSFEFMSEVPLPHDTGMTKHDILFLIDETSTMSAEINKLRDALNVSIDWIKNRMDVRIDVWSIRDYDRSGAEPPIEAVRRRASRITPSIMGNVLSDINADVPQHDEAEAYEFALQLAYLNSPWMPRKNSEKTIILAGDSYAHGWLRKPYWWIFFSEMKENSEYSDLYDQYLYSHERQRRDDEYINRHWDEASKQIGKDEFNEQIQIVPTKRKANWHRPNIFKAARECQQSHGYRIHTLQFGSNKIAEGCMRFIAMLGRGTALKSNQNTLVDQLVSIYCSPDAELFEKYQNSLDPESQDSIAPLSTFILK